MSLILTDIKIMLFNISRYKNQFVTLQLDTVIIFIVIKTRSIRLHCHQRVSLFYLTWTLHSYYSIMYDVLWGQLSLFQSHKIKAYYSSRYLAWYKSSLSNFKRAIYIETVFFFLRGSRSHADESCYWYPQVWTLPLFFGELPTFCV